MKKMKTAMWLVLLFMTTLSTQAQVTEGFEGSTFPPTDWTQYGAGWEQNNYIPHLGTFSAKCAFHSGIKTLVTPKISPDATNHIFKFWVRRDDWTASGEFFKVNISTTDNQEASFTTTLLTLTNADLTIGFVEKTVDLSTYNGQNIFVSISVDGVGGMGNDVFVDDVTMPNLFVEACAKPTAVNASVAPTSATISWTAPAAAPTDGYQYEVRTSGLAGSGPTGLVTSGDIIASVVSTDITGLSQETSYSFYIRSNCGTGNFSVWTSGYSFTTPISCQKPTALTASNFTTTSAQLSWTAGGSETAWNIEYGPSGFAHGAGTTVNGVTNPYMLNGLVSATGYDFYVKADCGGTDGSSSWAGPFGFYTTCSAVNVPYVENFDGNLTPNLLPCITITNDNGDANEWGIVNFASNSAPNSFAIFQNSAMAMNDWFFTPGLNLESTKTYKLNFSYQGGNTYSSASEKLEVKFGTSANAASMTSDQIFNNTNILSATFISASNTFTVPANGVYYIGFHAFSNIPSNVLVLDDISIVEDVAAVCATPIDLTATSITTTTATLGWTSSATDFNVRYREVEGTNPWINATASSNTLALSSLVENKQYQFQVQAICSATESSDWTPSTIFQTLSSTVCTTPINLQASNITETQAKITWTSSILYFNVRHRAVGTTTWTIFPAAYMDHILTELTPGTSYECQSQARCSTTPGDTSAWSMSVNFTTVAHSCLAPTNVAVTSITETSAFLGWTSSAPNFNVRYHIVGATTWEVASTITNSLELTSLTANTNYEFQVHAVCSGTTGDTSVWSSAFPFSTLDPAACNAPTILTATNITETTASIGWTSAITSFNVRYRIVGAPSWIETVATASPLALTTLIPASTYEFQVQAVCSATPGDVSGWSTAGQFTTTTPVATCNAPTALVVSAINTVGATLNWTKGGTETAWNIRYKKVADAIYTEDNNTTTKPYVIIALQSNTAYVWNVQAVCNATLSSAWSTESTFTTQSVGIENNSLSNLSVYSYNNQVNVINNDNLLVKAVVFYDMIGQEVATYAINSTDNILINTNFTTGNYVVKIVTDTQVMTKKLNIK